MAVIVRVRVRVGARVRVKGMDWTVDGGWRMEGE